MKKRIFTFITCMLIFTLISGCGAKSSSAQEQEKPKPAQETTVPDTEKEPAAQETTVSDTEKVPAAQETESDHPDAEQEVETSDVKHWKIEGSKLLGQTGPEDFVEFATFGEDSGIHDYATVVSCNEAKDLILIKQDAAFYRYDIKANQTTLINEGAVDSSYDAYDGWVYFVKPDESEYVIKDWKSKSGDIEATDNYRTSYNVCPNSYEISGFNEFSSIQEAIKNGDKAAAFEKGVIVEDNGDMYDFYNQYITNVHLPEAIDGNVYPAGDVTAYIKDGELNIYRFGESLITIDLPEGSFVVVDIFYQMKDSQVTVASALLYNFADRSMYKTESVSVNKLFGDVKDYFASGDGQIFWTDGENNAHVCKWFFDQNYASVAENVLGVSHYRDCKGFIVDDDKGIEYNGLHIFAF